MTIDRVGPVETSITIEPSLDVPGYFVVVRADERTASVHTNDVIEAQELHDLFSLMVKFKITAALFED